MAEKIIIVEDEYITAIALEHSLKQHYQILGICQTGDEVLSLVEKKCPDLILMDINLSGEMDGIETAEKLIEKYPEVAVIYLTGETDPNVVDRVKITEPFGYIVKPFNIKELEFTIRISLYKKQIEQKLKNNEKELTRHRDHLEVMVSERTAELERTNQQLQAEISERKIQEQAYRESEIRFRSIFEASPVGIIVFDLVGFHLDRFNPSFCSMLGYSADELQGVSLFSLVYPEDLAKSKQFFARLQAIQEEEYITIQIRLQHKQTKIIWVNFKVTRFFLHSESSQDSYLMLGNLENITEMKEAEEEILKKERHLRLIFASVKEYAIYTLDNEGCINSWNNGAERITGYREEEVLNKHIESFSSEEKLDFARIAKIAIERGHFKQEGWWFKKDGTRFWADILYTVMKDSEEKVIGFINITRNLTERKLMEDEIKQALEKEKELRELKSRFVSMASHEFRTPLSVILSSTDIIKRYSDKLGKEKTYDYLDSIKREIKNMTGLLDSVLLIGKIDSGKISFEPSYIDLKQLIESIVDKIISTSQEGVEIEMSFQDLREKYLLDEKLFQQILTNLLTNSVKYSPPKAIVSLVVKEEHEQLLIQVQDRGIGITKEDQERLFEPFHRGNNVGNISGTGLGMVIVKNSVEIHGGSIDFLSKVGQGTTFNVYIPVYKGEGFA